MEILGILTFHLLALFNMKFTAWPEMLAWPYLMVNSWLPYKDIAIAHTPNLLFALAGFFKIFGVGILQLKVFTWFLVLLADFVLFFVLSRLWKGGKAKAILATFAFVVLQVFYDGNGLWFEIALVPLSIMLFYLTTKRKYFISGVVWALMFFTKQTAVWFLIPFLLSLYSKDKIKLEALKKFIFGSLIVTSCYLVLFWTLGIFWDFYKWAINFGIFILPKSQGQIQLPALRTLAISLFPLTVFIPLILKKDKLGIKLFIWSLFGAMGAYPRFEYFHVQPALPFVAIAISHFFYEIYDKQKPHKIFLGLYIFGIALLISGFFIRNVSEGVRFYESDVSDVVNHVKQNTNPGEKIFVVNYWDNIYPLTNTLPAVDPLVPQLQWYMEQPNVQEKIVLDLENNRPRTIVIKKYTESGLSAYIPKVLFEYIKKNYLHKETVSGIDIFVLPQNFK